jgi:hypothetical protein
MRETGHGPYDKNVRRAALAAPLGRDPPGPLDGIIRGVGEFT